MPQLHERPRWHMWVALFSGMVTGYAALMGLLLVLD
jgi:hypothetical protein